MAFYLGRPIIPYIEYAVFKDYIAKNLCINKDKPKSCCQGKCYLKKQIEKNTESGNTEDKGSTRKVINQEVKEFITSFVSVPKATEINFPYAIYNERIIMSEVVSSIFVPPKQLLFS
jgi:hypothetical protein